MSFKEILCTILEAIAIGFYRSLIISIALSLSLTIGLWWAYKYESLNAKFYNRQFILKNFILIYFGQISYCFSLD